MQKKTPGRTWRTHKKDAYLKAFKRLGGQIAAADAVGISRTTVWEWRKDDPEFAEAYDSIEEQDTQELERAARKRAQGKSDLLAMFFLKARRPATYRDNVKVEHSGTVTLADFYSGRPKGENTK